MTKKKMIDALRGIDPETEITTAVLMQLESKGLIRSSHRGNRTYYNLELLILDLNKLFDLSGNTLPRVRSLYNAYRYTVEKGMGLSRRTIYGLEGAKNIPQLSIEKRTYVPLELFEGESEDILKNYLFETQYTDDIVEDDDCSYEIIY